MAAPPIVSSLLVALAIVVICLGMLLISRPDLHLLAIALFLPLWIGGTVAFHLMRPDRKSTRAERLQTQVAYPKQGPRIVTSRNRCLAVLVLTPVAVVLTVVYAYSYVEADRNLYASFAYGIISSLAVIGLIRDMTLWRREEQSSQAPLDDDAR